MDSLPKAEALESVTNKNTFITSLLVFCFDSEDHVTAEGLESCFGNGNAYGALWLANK